MTCPETCYSSAGVGYSCDWWDTRYGRLSTVCDYFSRDLGNYYLCDCQGCSCDPTPSPTVSFMPTPTPSISVCASEEVEPGFFALWIIVLSWDCLGILCLVLLSCGAFPLAGTNVVGVIREWLLHNTARAGLTMGGYTSSIALLACWYRPFSHQSLLSLHPFSCHVLSLQRFYVGIWGNQPSAWIGTIGTVPTAVTRLSWWRSSSLPRGSSFHRRLFGKLATCYSFDETKPSKSVSI